MTSMNGGSSSTNNLDIDAFLDFSGGSPSPAIKPEGDGKSTTSSSSMPIAAPHLALQQSFSGPSHQYDLHPQQTGLLPYSMNFDGSFSGGSSPSQTPGGTMSLSPEFKFNGATDIENDNMMSFFFPEQASGEFVQPNNISFNSDDDIDIDVLAGVKERSVSNASSVSMVSQSSSSRQQPRKAAASNTDPATELKIRQILEDVKRRALSSTDHNMPQGQNLPQLQRMKKDEEDMDEDERLLASEEGKKLSSKERRQLRNKVSARAFRSRRKEYISQLETEVNNKSTENADLREKLRTAEAENQSLRDLTRMLLASPQFSSFLDQMNPLTALNNSSSSASSLAPSNAPTENISVHRATVPEIRVSEQQLNDFTVPSYIPPAQNYSAYNPRKDTNPNQMSGVEDWPLAYVSNNQWGNSAAVFAAEVIPTDVDVNELVKPDDDWMCPADGFRPGFSSGILSQKEETPVDYSNHTDSNGQYIFTVFEDELEDVPDHLFDYFQIHGPVSEEKEKEEMQVDPETVLPSLGLKDLFTQIENHFSEESTPKDVEEKTEETVQEACRDPQLSRTLDILEKSYRRVGVFCGAS